LDLGIIWGYVGRHGILVGVGRRTQLSGDHGESEGEATVGVEAVVPLDILGRALALGTIAEGLEPSVKVG
jgi:hypothetical protein